MATYFCIDMKSFYASVECAERGLNPFETNLVVADESRGKGAITLAISPKMKDNFLFHSWHKVPCDILFEKGSN